MSCSATDDAIRYAESPGAAPQITAKKAYALQRYSWCGSERRRRNTFCLLAAMWSRPHGQVMCPVPLLKLLKTLLLLCFVWSRQRTAHGLVCLYNTLKTEVPVSYAGCSPAYQSMHNERCMG